MHASGVRTCVSLSAYLVFHPPIFAAVLINLRMAHSTLFAGLSIRRTCKPAFIIIGKE